MNSPQAFSGNAMFARVQRMLLEGELQAMRSPRHKQQARTPKQAVATLAEHRRIFDGIRAGRPHEAERAAFDHLVNSWMANWSGTRRRGSS